MNYYKLYVPFVKIDKNYMKITNTEQIDMVVIFLQAAVESAIVNILLNA